MTGKWPVKWLVEILELTFGQNVPVVFKRENFETGRNLQRSSEEVFRSSEKAEDEEIIFESRKTSNSIPTSIGDKLMVTN